MTVYRLLSCSHPTVGIEIVQLSALAQPACFHDRVIFEIVFLSFGNGDFNVKHYTGKFNAYQRTYVLIPNEKKYYAVLYIATKETIGRFPNQST